LQVKSKTYTMYLEDMPLDIGYASEEVALFDEKSQAISIGGHTGKTQLIITTPTIDAAFLAEMQTLSKLIPASAEHEISNYIIVASSKEQMPKIENFSSLVDSKGEFADMYGVRLSGAPFEGELTKALILISKDGAIFYDQFCDDLEQEFNTDMLYRKILAAQLCYTGKGCHE